MDFITRTLTITKTVHRYNGELKVLPPKTENSVRKLVIPQQAADLLKEERRKNLFSQFMFPSPATGGMYDPDAVGRIHKKLLARAGLEPGIRFHDLRHTFSTVMIQSGVDAKTLSNMLGHYSAAFTLDTYTHVTSQMQEAAAEKMSGFLAKISV